MSNTQKFNHIFSKLHTVKQLFAVLLMITASITVAEEQNVRPGINKKLIEPDYQVWVERFERPGREVFDQQANIIKALNIQPGMTIADIGAGTGLYTRLFSPAVGPQGKIYAVDIAKKFIDEIMSQAKDAGMNNVIGVINSQKDVYLKPGSIDLAFVCDTYHHFEYPRTMLRSIHEALRPGGSLVIIDFRKIKGVSSNWVMSHTRANKKTVISEIESEGFEITEDRNFLKTNFYLRFTRK